MRPTLVRRRLRHAFGLAAAGFLALALPAPALAEETAPDTVTLISDDGTTTELSALDLPDLSGLPGFEGTGITGSDGALHTDEPAGTTDGGPGTTSVIGADDRTRTSPTTGSTYSRSTVQLVHASNNQQFCTGWMFGPDTVITAGHCVFDTDADKWIKGTRVYPGRNGSKAPYGYCGASSYHTVTNWTEHDSPNWDMGAIKLNCNVGNTTGWLGAWWNTANLDDKAVTVRGYPCDKSFGTQWHDAGQITANTLHRMYYRIDTYHCQSGSPVYSYSVGDCGGPCVLGIHTTGKDQNGNNGSTRLTEAKFDVIMRWRNL